MKIFAFFLLLFNLGFYLYLGVRERKWDLGILLNASFLAYYLYN